MPDPKNTNSNWVEELVGFLRDQPGVGAVRVDPAAKKISIATLGNVNVGDLEAKLAATIAAVEAQLAAKASSKAPLGFSLKQEGGATVVGRETCVTAEKLWLWR